MEWLAVLFIYLADVCYDIEILLALCMLLSAGALIALFITYKDLNLTGSKCYLYSRRVMCVLIISALGAVLIPSKETMYMMAAGYLGVVGIEHIAEADTTNKSIELLNAWMDDQLANLEQEAEE